MSRKPSEPTATVSICVTEAEHTQIRDAAAAHGMAVSAWGASRLAAALSGPIPREAARAAAERIANTITPRGSRTGRVSMVLRLPEHEAMKAAAARMGIVPHALCQAIAIDAASREVAAMPLPVRRQVEAAKAERRNEATTLVRLPAELADVEVKELSAMLAQLVLATSAKILAGGGKEMAKGIQAMTARLADVDMVTVRVEVPELHFAGPAFVLDLPMAAYATTMAAKAARVLKAAQ